MSQNDMTIANANGATVRADINSALQALASANGGATAPSTTYPNQFWFDTVNDILKIRDEANANWVNAASLVGTTWIPYSNGLVLGTLANLNAASIGAALAMGANTGLAMALTSVSSGTPNFAASGNVVSLSGTATANTLGTVQAGFIGVIHYAIPVTVTHNTTSRILPTGANIAFAAGDVEIVLSLGSGNWRTIAVQLATGAPLAGPVLPGVAGLIITNGAATTNISVTYDQAVLVNAIGQGIYHKSGAFTIDCTVNAAINRLDTGALAATSEYHLWLIAKPDGTGVGALASLSSTAPTLPTGYSGGYSIRLGCMITGAAATFLRTKQIGKSVRYVVTAASTTTFLPSLTVANNATKTAIVVQGTTGAGGAQKIPSTASSITVSLEQAASPNTQLILYPSNDAGWTATQGARAMGGTSMGAGTFTGTLTVTDIQLESNSIYYIANWGATTAWLFVFGWTDRVNAW